MGISITGLHRQKTELAPGWRCRKGPRVNASGGKSGKLTLASPVQTLQQRMEQGLLITYRCELLQAWSQHKSNYFNGKYKKNALCTPQRPSPISSHTEMWEDGLWALTHVQVVLAGVIQHLPEEAERKLDNEQK